MANNLSIKDSLAASKVLKTTENTSVHTPHHNIDQFNAKLAGEDLTNDVLKVEQRNSFYFAETTGDKVIKTQPGFLHSIVIGYPGTGDAYVLVYNSITAVAPVIAKINATGRDTIILDVAFTTGLTIKIVGDTSPAVTVSYR